MSLATELMSASGEDSIKRTTHTLGEAGLHWLGLAMRSGNVLTVNGLRIGVLAYCAVYKECAAIMNTPYSPVRYSSKTAATDIKSLKSVSLNIMIRKYDFYMNLCLERCRSDSGDGEVGKRCKSLAR